MYIGNVFIAVLLLPMMILHLYMVFGTISYFQSDVGDELLNDSFVLQVRP